MPVLLNKDSGLAENLPDQAAAGALQSGTHEIPLVSPEGDFGSAPHEDASRLIQQGYQQPSPDQLSHLLKEAKYSTTGQQIAGGLEQVAKGVAGPLAPLAERALGVPAEDIRGREETTGTAEKMILQGAGLVASSFIPGGQARVLGAIGKAGTELMGIGNAANTLTKIGSAAATAAVENAAFQVGDEMSKAVVNDPDQTASSAMVNVGLAGTIGAGFGGALGAVSPLWAATLGPKAENLLRAIQSRANGETLPISEDLTSVLAQAEKNGLKIPDEIKAGLSDNRLAHDYFQELKESGTTTGDAVRETLDKFKDDMAGQLASVFKVEGAPSAFEAGEKAKDAFVSKIEELNANVESHYDKISNDREAILTSENERKKGYDKLFQIGQEEFGTDSPQYDLFKHYGERFLARDSIAKLDQLRTELFSEIRAARNFANPNFEKARALGEIRDFIGNFQDQQIGRAARDLHINAGVPEAQAQAAGDTLIKDTQAARKVYRDFIGTIGEVVGAAKLGKAHSYSQILEVLDKVPAAKLADKLFDVKNVEALRYIQKEFPGVIEPIIQAKKTSMLEAASKTGDLKHNSILNQVNSLPKEVKDMMFTKDEQNIINATGKILRESGKRLNPSGTAGTWAKLMSNMPAGVGAMASMLMGHGPTAGFLAGHAAKFLGHDVPDAAKMSLLKYLGSSGNVDASAWKAAADYIQHAMKGEKLILKASSAAIKAGQEVLPKSQIPDEKSRNRLEKKLRELKTDQSSMLDVGGHIGGYMPDHASALAQMSMNAVNYLNQIRPHSTKLSPLDSEVQPPKSAIADYNRALDIAEQPLVLMQSIQDGTLTPSDLSHLTNLHPEVYKKLTQSLMSAMVDRKTNEEPIKYKQRLSLSLFMGQALDSTMLPQSIVAAQPPPPPQDQMMPQQTKKHGSMKDINKLAQGNASGSQTREMQKAGTIKT